MWNSRKRLFQLVKGRRMLVSLSILFFVLVATIGTVVMDNHSLAMASNPYVTLPDSFTAAPAGAQRIGSYVSAVPLTVSIVLQPSNPTAFHSLLAGLYNPGSPQYHKWLSKGLFNALFAPSAAQIAQVTGFLQRSGLTVTSSSPTPFILRVTGAVTAMQATFHTRINSYRAADGQSFYQNDSAVLVPANLGGVIMSVVGLSNTVRLHSNYVITSASARKAGVVAPQYGAGPGGSGLTPAQISSLYGANGVYGLGSQGQGSDTTMAVFELSGYTPTDITTYEHQFFGPLENVPIEDINVDGGPVSPICPAGDTCGPCPSGCNTPDYSNDIEVVADIQAQIALAPQIARILVYNAPNDVQGLTTLDEYFRMANDDLADSISTSWGLCEQDAGFGFAQAESIAMEQMAAQGQSLFAATGDNGAYDCLRSSGDTSLAVDDPASQPFVTSVGGTSFSAFDPGANQYPNYPTNTETVWNGRNLCNHTPTGLNNCVTQGAGGGGVSTFWAMPAYQHGNGVLSSFSRSGAYCGQLASLYCREVPDISANADEYSPYAEYCTGDPATNSFCATFSSSQTPPGWFSIGGTSLSSPLWSAIIALWDSVHGGERLGCANYELYTLFRAADAYSKYFHDIADQGEHNNGYYPTTAYYDMATGIGTPRISALAEATVYPG